MSSYYMDNSYAEGGLDSNKLKEEFENKYNNFINENFIVKMVENIEEIIPEILII